MPDPQSFHSETYKNACRYPFEARFDQTLWTATIRDESGARRGVISCQSPWPELRGEALEDAVCDWVHRAVQHNVGFSDDQLLSEYAPLSSWVFTSALQVELERARATRAELAMTLMKFTEAYAAYRDQRAETSRRRG